MALLAAVNVVKFFGPNQVLKAVDFNLRAGTVHALLGQNGAGKSTLIKILTGVERPTNGTILFDGREVQFDSPLDSRAAGIAAVYQELSLVPQLSVAENIFLGRWPRRRGTVRWGTMLRDAAAALQIVGLDLDPRTLVSRLTVAQRQLVEIARAMAFSSKVLILDEPTAAISRHEVEGLFAVIRKMRAQGTGIIYISHRLDEIERMADDVTVLRDGRVVFSGEMARVDRDGLVRYMVGRSVTVPTRQPRPAGEVVLAVEQAAAVAVSGRLAFSEVSFQLQRGQVLGITGPVGAGALEVGRAVAGILPLVAGRMTLHGGEYRPRNPLAAVQAGFAFVSDDRGGEGLVLQCSIRTNIAAPVWSSLASRGLIADRVEADRADPFIERLGVVPGRPLMTAGDLSGGNQQKVVLAKWLCRNASIFILSEPTRGMDVAAKDDVYRLIDELCRHGAAVLLISSEVDEVVALSDHVLILRHGRPVASFAADQLTNDVVLAAVLGAGGAGA